MKIGVVKATKAAHAPMLKMAPIASSPPKISNKTEKSVSVNL